MKNKYQQYYVWKKNDEVFFVIITLRILLVMHIIGNDINETCVLMQFSPRKYNGDYKKVINDRKQ